MEKQELKEYLLSPPISNKQPLLWGDDGKLNKLILGKIIEFNDRLSQHGYQIVTGTEQEFTFIPNSQGYNSAQVEQSRQFHSKHIENNSNLTPNQKHARQQELAAMPAEDILYLNIQEKLPGIVEERFGNGKNGKSIRDFHGVFESALLPSSSPLESIANYHKFVRTLESEAKNFGATPTFWKRDLSFSVIETSTGRNLMDFVDREDPRGLRAADGVLAVMNDAILAFAKKKAIKDEIMGSKHTIGNGRNNRIKKGESPWYEIRVNNNPKAGDHLAATMMFTLAGIEFGLHHHKSSEYRDSVVESRFKNVRIFETPKGDDSLFFTKEILNSSKVREEDGGLNISGKDVFTFSVYLPKELGLEKSDQHKFLKFFSDIRIPDKVAGQEDQPRKLIIPDLSKYFTGNTEKAQELLERINFGRKVVTPINKGYDMSGNDYYGKGSDPKPIEVHLDLMAKSPILNKMFNRDFMQKMVDAISSQHQVPSVEVPPASSQRTK